jgi:putative ABC transport system substrate-binding protein
LRELVPTAGVIAVLINSGNPAAEAEMKELSEAARLLGIHLNIQTVSNRRDIDAAFQSLVKQRADALLVSNDAVFFDRRDQLAVLTARHAIPAIYFIREFAAAGGLMSYGTSQTDANRIAGTYVGRILRGEKPSDLPVQQSTKVELIINMRTAKAIGLAIPPSLFALATEVIE